MDRSHYKRQTILLCALLCAATVASFWPVVQNGFIHFDDPDYVTQNARVLRGWTWGNVVWAFQTGQACNWHPLTWLSHMLDVQLFGLKAGGHHLVSLLFHTANSVLLFLLLQRLTGARWRSAFVAALFALHPLHVESVAWVAERKDVLSTFFFLLTLMAYAKYVSQVSSLKSQVSSPGKKGTQLPSSGPSTIYHQLSTLHVFRWYVLSIVLFALGLMSKPMLVTLPCVLLLLDYWPLQRLPLGPRGLETKRLLALIREKAPFFLLAAVACVVTMLVQGRQGAVAPEGLPVESRVANALLSYLRYLEKLCWPTHLAIFYPHPATRNPALSAWINWHVGVAAVVVVVLSLAVLRYLRRHPSLAVGWYWYVGTLVPVIGFVQVGAQAMADRYMYIPCIGVFILVTWAAAELAPTLRLGPRGLGAAGLVVLAACGTLSWKQAKVWQDDLTVFGHALAVTTENPTAHINYGGALEMKGDVDGAMAHYQQALAIDASADAYLNYGHALAAKGKLTEAIEQYQAALRVQPRTFLAHFNLAHALQALRQLEEAAAHYQETVQLEPDFVPGHCSFAQLLADQGKFAEAEREYEAALQLEPTNAQAKIGLALALALAGRYGEALPTLRQLAAGQPKSAATQVTLANVLIEAGQETEARTYYAAALRLEPGLAQTNLEAGKALLARGEVLPALARLTQSVRLAPDNAEAHEQLGWLLAQQGQLTNALAHFLEVVRLRPDAQAHYDVALALVALGRHSEAEPHYRQAIELKPDWPVPLNDLAWILATHPRAELRNGAEAVRLAQRACELTGGKEARFWGTLDAAYAEAGRFEEAMATAEKARALALSAGNKAVAEAAQQRQELYRARQAFRQQ